MYDGWNLIAELDENLNLIKTFTWGTDISGTEQGAGGVGGLLSMTVHTTGKTYFYCHDGNGNVVGLVDSSSGKVVQEYEYSPFGELLRGGEDVVNPFKFSGKYTDSETEMAYYGHRYYSSEMGRWLNCDPIEERGGVNLYGFVGNDGIGKWDLQGLICGITFHRAPISKTNQNINVGHQWIEYEGGSLGFWPQTDNLFWGPGEVKNPDPDAGTRSGTNWETQRIDWATLKFGIGKGKKAACATCPEFNSCIVAAAASWKGATYCLPGQNCRSFTAYVLGKCGLSGK